MHISKISMNIVIGGFVGYTPNPNINNKFVWMKQLTSLNFCNLKYAF